MTASNGDRRSALTSRSPSRSTKTGTTDSNRREQRSRSRSFDHGGSGARPEYGAGENTHDTARRYLTEDRLTVRQASQTNGVAHVRGDSGLTYRAQWSPDLGWLCNCVTRRQGAHLIALRRITDTNEHDGKP